MRSAMIVMGLAACSSASKSLPPDKIDHLCETDVTSTRAIVIKSSDPKLSDRIRELTKMIADAPRSALKTAALTELQGLLQVWGASTQVRLAAEMAKSDFLEHVRTLRVFYGGDVSPTDPLFGPTYAAALTTIGAQLRATPAQNAKLAQATAAANGDAGMKAVADALRDIDAAWTKMYEAPHLEPRMLSITVDTFTSRRELVHGKLHDLEDAAKLELPMKPDEQHFVETLAAWADLENLSKWLATPWPTTLGTRHRALLQLPTHEWLAICVEPMPIDTLAPYVPSKPTIDAARDAFAAALGFAPAKGTPPTQAALLAALPKP